MSRVAKKLKSPAGSPGSAGALEPSDPRVPLRLAIARGVLGLELYEPIEMGPLEAVALEVALPSLKFPVDLSGGVPVFRHRRGRLEHLGLRLSLTDFGRWLGRRVGDVLGGLEAPVATWVVDGGIGLGFHGATGALAFDLVWVPVESDARCVVSRVRGVDIGGPALGLALQIVDTFVAPLGGRREGRIVTVEHAGLSVARELMPSLGARAPSSGGGRFSNLEVQGDLVSVDLDSAYPPTSIAADGSRALELALLTRVADDELALGHVDAAREAFLAALEQAPRHPEIHRVIAEIDVYATGRTDAALAMLVEAMLATDAGVVGAELLAQAGDHDGAREALSKATRIEEFAPLAALAWGRIARLHDDGTERLRCLDEAVARCPSLRIVRWDRLEGRLARGDVEGALADAEHLEAATHGSSERHEVCRRAAKTFLDAGYQRDARALFERALRYVPADAAATAGLARSLLDLGQRDRALGLLERAITLGREQGRPQPGAVIDLAKVLAELGDRPQAIARVREVPASADCAVEAYTLEGRWRADVGDIAGASLAYGRLRQAVELASEVDGAAAATALVEAARFERDVQRDHVAAERHAAAALRLAPRDRAVSRLYRDVAAALGVMAQRSRRSSGDDEPSADSRESLEARLRTDPSDDATASELADVLEGLGRTPELLALLSARYEDATGDGRSDWAVRLRSVLQTLIDEARAAGRHGEAAAYSDELSRLS